MYVIDGSVRSTSIVFVCVCVRVSDLVCCICRGHKKVQVEMQASLDNGVYIKKVGMPLRIALVRCLCWWPESPRTGEAAVDGEEDRQWWASLVRSPRVRGAMARRDVARAHNTEM